ncbi:hypothetical protein Gasu2_70050 [Galdieria sulphuraria]|uniref:Pinin/SDK/MemA protein domain-containing protein n=1 Tax=Galdieria sulphuraria TaxID=130081 RepID=M2XQQ5_GALSU|nr:uncharacterized protein Gasu_03390 [Galdieria sulphuraria]EME32567.1 hypothetical protein Gasu_03390 [Galdieria sulphuraria]GJD12945.1 hypothetical protein Gasu2_70050 [Galdieria sulphuraria]|eukprot:XP_005709087.1 hypothetical protein Gasu_03390 [Galdieria sulphuraria]
MNATQGLSAKESLERDEYKFLHSSSEKSSLEDRDEQAQLLAELEELDRQRRELEAKLQEVEVVPKEENHDQDANFREARTERLKRLRTAEPRDKKMFGLLMGTLKAAKKELAETETSEKMKQRQELEKRAAERLNEVHREILEQQEKLRERRKQLKEEFNLRKQLARLRSDMRRAEHLAQVKERFLWTKIEPTIRWCPRQVDHDFLKPLWEESARLAREEYEESLSRLQREVALVEEQLALKRAQNNTSEANGNEIQNVSRLVDEEQRTTEEQHPENTTFSVDKTNNIENITEFYDSDIPVEESNTSGTAKEVEGKDDMKEEGIDKSQSEEREDFSKLTVKELRAELQKRGVDDKRVKLKKDLIELLDSTIKNQ